ncbi:tyrosine-protein phosphatase, partial [Bacillus altitudinis]
KNYPLMLHCTSGKDRTGFLSALIQAELDDSSFYNSVIMNQCISVFAGQCWRHYIHLPR